MNEHTVQYPIMKILEAQHPLSRKKGSKEHFLTLKECFLSHDSRMLRQLSTLRRPYGRGNLKFTEEHMQLTEQWNN